MWTLYQTMSRQWRVGPRGPVGLDLCPFIAEIDRRGWDRGIALELLSEIEWQQIKAYDSGG